MTVRSGFHLTAEHKAKISRSLRGRPGALRGRRLSDSHRRTLSEAAREAWERRRDRESGGDRGYPLPEVKPLKSEAESQGSAASSAAEGGLGEGPKPCTQGKAHHWVLQDPSNGLVMGRCKRCKQLNCWPARVDMRDQMGARG